MASSATLHTSSVGSTTSGFLITTQHLVQEDADHLLLCKEIETFVISNMHRFREEQGALMQRLGNLQTRNLEYRRMKKEEVPAKEEMLKELTDETTQKDGFKQSCDEVVNYVATLRIKINRLDHPPVTVGNKELVKEMEELYKVMDKRKADAERDYYNPAESMCDQMNLTHANLTEEVRTLKATYKSYYGPTMAERAYKKAASVVSGIAGYVWPTSTPAPTSTPPVTTGTLTLPPTVTITVSPTVTTTPTVPAGTPTITTTPPPETQPQALQPPTEQPKTEEPFPPLVPHTPRPVLPTPVRPSTITENTSGGTPASPATYAESVKKGELPKVGSKTNVHNSSSQRVKSLTGETTK